MKVILFVLGLLAGSIIADDDVVLKKFHSDGIVESLKLEAAPEKLLPVFYPSEVTVDGTELTPTQVKDVPEVKLSGEDGQFYTLVFSDIDITSEKHPNISEGIIWMVVNIEGKDFKSGQTKVEYIGAGPPKSTGIHRFVFLLFQQSNGKQDYDFPTVSNTEVKGRLIPTHQLITDYKLKLVAGNFFFAQYDDYVPILHAQLGLSDLAIDGKIEKSLEKTESTTPVKIEQATKDIEATNKTPQESITEKVIATTQKIDLTTEKAEPIQEKIVDATSKSEKTPEQKISN